MGVFKLEKDNIVLDADYCEFYIPQSFFDSTKGFAEDFTEYVNVLGVFRVGIFEKGKLVQIKTMNNPNIMKVYEYETEWRTMNITGNKEEKCKVLKYVKGQVLFSANAVQNVANIEMFLGALLSGSLPNSVPYPKLLELWRTNLRLNGYKLHVSSTVLEMILAVCFRSKQHKEHKFARSYGKSLDVGDCDYATASIREICQYASTFTSIIFEDIDSMITSSINRQREGKEETESPLERIIKM